MSGSPHNVVKQPHPSIHVKVSNQDRSGTQFSNCVITNLEKRMLLFAILCAAVLGVTAQSPILISEFCSGACRRIDVQSNALQ